jgi:PIN domain nuclease of toxin-antitoxin system
LRILLDTHLLVWWLADSPSLSGQARQVAVLPWHHRDPFDRMLVAQAQAENLTLLTADDRVTAYGNFVRLVR